MWFPLMIDGVCLNDWKSPAFAPVLDDVVAVGDVGTPGELFSGDPMLIVRGGGCFGGTRPAGGWNVCGGVMGKVGSFPSKESGSSTRPGGRDGTGAVGEACGSRDDNWSGAVSLTGGDTGRRPRAARSRSTAW